MGTGGDENQVSYFVWPNAQLVSLSRLKHQKHNLPRIKYSMQGITPGYISSMPAVSFSVEPQLPANLGYWPSAH